MEFVDRLIEARFARHYVDRPSELGLGFDLDAGYRYAHEADRALRVLNWSPVGRKLGFTNVATWSEFDLATPIWAHIYDKSVLQSDADEIDVLISDLLAPRIELEIVVGLNDKIAEVASGEALLDAAIDWIAPGFEIVDCHFADWKFNAADIVADFGAHARLVIGTKVAVKRSEVENLSSTLSEIPVTLRRGSTVIDTGVGRNALGGPIHGLGYLVETLKTQHWADGLAPGEIVTTGTLTHIPFVTAGERWSADFQPSFLGTLSSNLV
jgi:2-keto-4-pentenoate hydratase